MTQFFLGMLVMYLIISELLVLSTRKDWKHFDIFCGGGLLTWILTFPQSLFYFVGRYVYKLYNYYNTKALIYDSVLRRWFYCQTKDLKYYRKALTYDAGVEEQHAKKLYENYKFEFDKFYHHRSLISDYVNHRTGINIHYVPKSVWSCFQPASNVDVNGGNDDKY